ncbi:hypothetical protein O0L34_g9702 [Tuta absoluta]|nr:hypothetical protein O0L34_g9702 [Tuta absoluta]
MFRRKTKTFGLLFIGIAIMVFYCEFLIYYVVIAQCSWPVVNKTDPNEILKAFMLTDIHMLGHRNGNPVDKWRREWQMHRAFQTIISLHNPDVVFVLGDIFDEGQYATDDQFDKYVEGFYDKFYVPDHIKMFILVGNHDIGFHHSVRPSHVERFYKRMNSTSAQLLTLKNSHFVLVNSVAMHGDSCEMCSSARKNIEDIADKLECARDPAMCNDGAEPTIKYSRPILLQHYPLVRSSDAICAEPDSVPWYEKDIPFTPKIECLSQEATDYLATKLRPRAVFEGHTHYGCLLHHSYQDQHLEFIEHTIPSFSWRNIFTPKYMLVTITPTEYAYNKCGLPGEHTIVITAVIIFAITIYLARKRLKK